MGDDEGQRGLACYSPWGHKASDTTGWLNNSNTPFNKFLVDQNGRVDIVTSETGPQTEECYLILIYTCFQMTGFSCKMTNSIRVKTYKIITNKKRGIGKKKFYKKGIIPINVWTKSYKIKIKKNLCSEIIE